ncbi:MAG: hypothetical protein GWN93_24975 [Deltaproteobacteria bacterium]|nr:hypothetical protein [Deltaproteobacteria bacterium]
MKYVYMVLALAFWTMGALLVFSDNDVGFTYFVLGWIFDIKLQLGRIEED